MSQPIVPGAAPAPKPPILVPGRGAVVARDGPARMHGHDDCCFCDLPIDKPGFGLPMHEGEPVSKSDKTTDWAGFDCCSRCFEAYELADLPGLRIRYDAIKQAESIYRRCRESLERMAKGVVGYLEELDRVS